MRKDFTQRVCQGRQPTKREESWRKGKREGERPGNSIHSRQEGECRGRNCLVWSEVFWQPARKDISSSSPDHMTHSGTAETLWDVCVCVFESKATPCSPALQPVLELMPLYQAEVTSKAAALQYAHNHFLYSKQDIW